MTDPQKLIVRGGWINSGWVSQVDFCHIIFKTDRHHWNVQKKNRNKYNDLNTQLLIGMEEWKKLSQHLIRVHCDFEYFTLHLSMDDSLGFIARKTSEIELGLSNSSSSVLIYLPTWRKRK